MCEEGRRGGREGGEGSWRLTPPCVLSKEFRTVDEQGERKCLSFHVCLCACRDPQLGIEVVVVVCIYMHVFVC